MTEADEFPSERDTRIRKMIYRANHRGIKEMDIVLGTFAIANLSAFSDVEMDQFEELLQENDRDLLPWFTGEADFPKDKPRQMFDRVLNSLAADFKS